MPELLYSPARFGPSSSIVVVAYAAGRWLAEVAPDYDKPLDCGTLQKLIDVVKWEWPDQSLLFVVDQSSIEGRIEAETEFLEASEKRGALVISSVQEF